jgi:uncharacterized protein (TIGR00299 family) protein
LPSGSPLAAFADLDLGRAARRGYPEAIYCAGKTPEQVGGIAAAVRSRPDVVTLFTRAGAAHAEAVLRELPSAFHDAEAGLLAWPPEPPDPSGGLVVVLTAGTSDLAVAREAQLTARYLGRETELVADVGVAGLHRVLGKLDLLGRARVVVVAAGMDGALPSVVAGLVAVPVVALPTSVGYGAAFEGLAALLAMLNSCSPGVAVVNIDNGYGAGHLAAQIAAPALGAAHSLAAAASSPEAAQALEVAPAPAGPPGVASGPVASPSPAAPPEITPDPVASPETASAPAALLDVAPGSAASPETAPNSVASPEIGPTPAGLPEVVVSGRHGWIDASAGVAGDMLLGALVDAGASLVAVQRAVDLVVPDGVRVVAAPVVRGGLRAIKVDVTVLDDDPPHRSWRAIRGLLSALPDGVRERALAVFSLLATVEARVHQVDVDEVHFHEVGSLDSIADVVGVCAALADLGVTTVSAGEVAVGSGRVRTAHGELPVPAPAVAELARGWQVRAGGRGELATPTGMAVIRALSTSCEGLPAMTVEVVGVGAGGRDFPDRPNVTRIVLGAPTGRARPAVEPALDPPGDAPAGDAHRPAEQSHDPARSAHDPAGQPHDPAGQPHGPAGVAGGLEESVLLEANVDDLDPRLWPGVLSGLLECGASDAWLVPIVMKKGRPAHTLSVLGPPGRVAALRARIFRDTSTLGVREGALRRAVLDRKFVPVELEGGTVTVKIGYAGGVIVQVMPEFEDVAALARSTGRAERVVLQAALSAATAAGLIVGCPAP